MPMSGPPRHTSANRRKSRPRKMFWRLKRKSPAIRSHYYRQLDQNKWKTYPTTVSEMFCFSEPLESRFELGKRFQIQLVVDSPATDFFVKLWLKFHHCNRQKPTNSEMGRCYACLTGKLDGFFEKMRIIWTRGVPHCHVTAWHALLFHLS